MSARPEAVTETVYFTVSVTSVRDESGGHWVTWGLQTGVITVGATKAEAEERSETAHILLVRGYKKLGEEALAEFMEECGIDYRIGGEKTEEHRPPSRSGGFASAA